MWWRGTPPIERPAAQSAAIGVPSTFDATTSTSENCVHAWTLALARVRRASFVLEISVISLGSKDVPIPAQWNAKWRERFGFIACQRKCPYFAMTLDDPGRHGPQECTTMQSKMPMHMSRIRGKVVAWIALISERCIGEAGRAFRCRSIAFCQAEIAVFYMG